jgi:hypothetical protein
VATGVVGGLNSGGNSKLKVQSSRELQVSKAHALTGSSLDLVSNQHLRTILEAQKLKVNSNLKDPGFSSLRLQLLLAPKLRVHLNLRLSSSLEL